MNPRNIQFNSETNILDLSNMTSHLNLFFFIIAGTFPNKLLLILTTIETNIIWEQTWNGTTLAI